MVFIEQFGATSVKECIKGELYVKSSVDIRTFEILLRSYEVREERLESWENHAGGSLGSRKRRQRSTDGSNGVEASVSATIVARPSSEGRGHTGYLTFARLRCVI